MVRMQIPAFGYRKLAFSVNKSCTLCNSNSDSSLSHARTHMHTEIVWESVHSGYNDVLEIVNKLKAWSSCGGYLFISILRYQIDGRNLGSLNGTALPFWRAVAYTPPVPPGFGPAIDTT